MEYGKFGGQYVPQNLKERLNEILMVSVQDLKLEK